MTPRGFSRFMVDNDLSGNEKIGRFTDAEFRALVCGVWSLAARAEPRGFLAVAGKPATAQDVARRAHCSAAVARSTLAKMHELGMLETEDGLDHVHDWEAYNPAPKEDRTAAERQRKKRERDAKREAARLVLSLRCHGRDNGVVTPPEVEVEVEVEDEVGSSLQAEPSAQPPEAPPGAAHDQHITMGKTVRVFARWRDRCRKGSSRVMLTEQRDKAISSRLRRDGFTVEELLQAVDGAARSIEAEELDYEHQWTELYKIMVDAEHVRAWIAYEQTGDYEVIQEVMLSEQPRTAA
jgi:hypothetical protein